MQVRGGPGLQGQRGETDMCDIEAHGFAGAGVLVKNMCGARTDWSVTEVTSLCGGMFPNVRFGEGGSGREKGERELWRMHLLGGSPHMRNSVSDQACIYRELRDSEGQLL